MLIRFRKISDDRHELSIVRPDGGCETVACETRSYLMHDLLHYAVEAEAGIDDGFWGTLARGETLARMNDRQHPPAGDGLGRVETVVGALHGATKGAGAAALYAGIRDYAVNLGIDLPAWLDEPFVEAVVARMRALRGRWRATRFGEALELPWPLDG